MVYQVGYFHLHDISFYPCNYCSLDRGFRRVPYSTVSDGAVTYKNSLFQRDQPALVKHMRMDSDVQDVFERQQHTASTGAGGGISGSDLSPPVASVGPTVASWAAPGVQRPSQQPGIATANGLQQLISALQGQSSIPSSIGAQRSLNNNGQAQAPTQQGPTSYDLGLLNVLQQSLNPSTVPANSDRVGNQNLSNGDSGTAMSSQNGVLQQLQSLLTNQQGQRQQAAIPQLNSGSQGSDAGLASAVATLLQQLQRGGSLPIQEPSPEVIRQNLLLKIIESCQAYVNQPQPNSSRGMAIFTCIKLLLVLGMQELNQETSPSNITGSS